MANRVGTSRRKTRSKLRKPADMRGKTNINAFLQTFNDGERVVVKLDPAYQRGMCHPRFQGHSGSISGKKGMCYLVNINDGNKQKKLIVHPAHLKRN